jgi:hypothetical protein
VEFKNVSGDDLDLPTIGSRGTRVPAGETVNLTGDEAKALSRSPLFERVDSPSKTTEKE